jgi:predicted nucleic acid-binding protein
LTKPLVFDATPLIYVVRVSMSETLRRLRDPKLMPQSVYHELLKGERLGKPEASVVRELVDEGTMKVSSPANTSVVHRLIKLAAEDEGKPLHRAEAEAIALSLELRGVVISDDHVARSTANLVNAEVHGTGYLVGRMYQERHISKDEAMRKVGEMRRAGWRLAEDDYQAILDHPRGA